MARIIGSLPLPRTDHRDGQCHPRPAHRAATGAELITLERGWRCLECSVRRAGARLLARVEAGEEVEIARDGVPVARLVRVEPATPGSRFLAALDPLA